MTQRTPGLVLSGLLSVLAFGGVQAQEPPQLALNEVAGVVEAVDTAEDGRVRHTIEPSVGDPEVALVSALPGLGGRLSIDAYGDSWVSWWSDAAPGSVHVTKRTLATGDWTPELQLSPQGADSRSPSMIHHGGTVWVAYGIWSTASISIVVQGVIDNPEPIPNLTPIADIDVAADIDLRLHSDLGNLWTTWVEIGDGVCWSEFDEALEAWSQRACQPLAGESVAAIRRDIRDLVVTQ